MPFDRLIPAAFRRTPPPQVPGGQRVYAVGDVHGRMDLLVRLVDHIRDDNSDREPAKTRIIVLGDFIDRGPDSAATLSFLREWSTDKIELLVLLGNHERALIESLQGDEVTQDLWMGMGGAATLKSYGVEPRRTQEPGLAFADRLLTALTTETVGWLQSLPLSWRSGDYFFCHAGVRPGVPLDEQRPEDLLGIKSDFLRSKSYHGAVIVHGHSDCGSEPVIASNHLCLDTGAYKSGRLTAAGFQGEKMWIIKAGT